MGKSVSYSTIDGGDCKPADTTDGKIIYPCGLIANSLFNGTFLSRPYRGLVLLQRSDGLID